jgi:hypothetical protein
MENVTQHEIVWTLIKKGKKITQDQVVAVYQDHSALRRRFTELNKRFPNAYTISSIHFYPSK